MDNNKNDEYYVRLIIEDIDKILKYSSNLSYEEFAYDEQLIDAVLFRLIQMTENIKKLSASFKEKETYNKYVFLFLSARLEEAKG